MNKNSHHLITNVRRAINLFLFMLLTANYSVFVVLMCTVLLSGSAFPSLNLLITPDFMSWN